MSDGVKERMVKATLSIIEHLEKQLAFHRAALARMLGEEA